MGCVQILFKNGNLTVANFLAWRRQKLGISEVLSGNLTVAILKGIFNPIVRLPPDCQEVITREACELNFFGRYSVLDIGRMDHFANGVLKKYVHSSFASEEDDVSRWSIKGQFAAFCRRKKAMAARISAAAFAIAFG